VTAAVVDETFMRRALALAEQGRGLTSPNPMVGALVVRDGQMVGEGFHERAGGAHAEVIALEAAGANARGATLYLTLEPCVHHGRTPPCAPRVVAAGVRRVVIAIGDPDPRVAGRGIAALRAAGVETVVGVLGDEAARQNRAFRTAMREGRPHVTLKGAMTVDGKIADLHGASRWITGQPARQVAHRLRSESDAIVVGVGTALRDDPELTVRLARPWPREPFRVVLDSAARTPPDARLIRAGACERALILVGPEAPAARRERLAEAGARVIACPTRRGRIDPGAALGELFAREVRAVLVEGGAEVHGSFLESGLVDRVAVFVAPMLLGGRGAPGLAGGEGLELKSAVRLGALTVRQVGNDVLIEGDVLGSGHEAAGVADGRRPDGAS
jgi:diaminohydroxyphosphoribosylaminopyrimidine deaminase/5-amino-6-(5-phosphoribosylamino)uracil reductase